ncbi:MAG: transcription termination/antitermination protein NusA [Chloroflexi bacterium]|nr:transcription termination/antitermination protein NusA [Chloroflexota bacterium]
MNKELLMAINQICAERNLKPQVVIEAVEQALVSAYRRNFGSAGNVEAHLDPETGDMRIFTRMKVVPEDELTDTRTQISVEDAAAIDPAKAAPGEEILVEQTPKDFGRIAAQTAKQVVLQRIREAERDAVYEDYAEREGELVTGVVRSIDYGTGNVIVALDGGRAEGVLSRSDQIPGERYRPNNTVLAYVSEVSRGNRGPVIHLSRTHRNMLRRLLEKEVPEIKQGVVEVKAIAREAGSRSKVAVASTQPGVDPVGSCVGMRGVRIQNIVNELNGEKIDIIEWDPDEERFVANALSPAKVTDVLLFPEHDRTAVVIVPDKQLSLAIGKEGQNARLVAKLTGWRIDIKSETEADAEGLSEAERDRLRRERKERAQKDDLLEAARRILVEEEVDLLPAIDEIDFALEEEQLDLGAVLEEPQAEIGDLLSEVELPEEQTGVVDLDAVLVEEEDEVRKAEAAAQEIDLEAQDLASKLTEAMRSGDAFQIDEDAFARIFGEEAEAEEASEEEEEKGKTKRKKKRRKDRRLVFDETQGRTVAVKRRKRGRSSAIRDFDFDDFEDFE